MLKVMFLFLTLVDWYAINAAIDHPLSDAGQFGKLWLVYYSALVGCLIGVFAWKEFQGKDSAVPAIIRLVTANSLIFAALAATLEYSGKNPHDWPKLHLFLSVYLFRLAPLASAAVVLTPFLLLTGPRFSLVVCVALCQLCSWLGAYLTLGGEGQPWKEVFLMWGLWAPNWGFGLMAGGLLLRSLQPKPESSIQSEP